jgi:hypothetical protein
LVDNHASIDDIRKASRDLFARGIRRECARHQPDRHHGRFAEPGRQVEGRRNFAGTKLQKQPLLPREGIAALKRGKFLSESRQGTLFRRHGLLHDFAVPISKISLDFK